MASVEENLDKIMEKIGGGYMYSTKSGERFAPTDYRFTGVIFKPIMDGEVPKRDEKGNILREAGTEKMLKVFQFQHEKQAQDYARTIKDLRQLQHLNIVTINDDGPVSIDNVPHAYIIMQKGERDLEKEIENSQSKLSSAECVDAIKQITSGLDYMWKRNIVHRDVKPKNIIVFNEGQRTYQICDFQTISNLRLASSTHTDPIGTNTYIAPEKYNDPKNRDPASDLYSLGVMFSQLATKTRVADMVNPNPDDEDPEGTWKFMKFEPESLFEFIGLDSKVTSQPLVQMIKKLLAYDRNKEDYMEKYIDPKTKREKSRVNKAITHRSWDDRYKTPTEVLFDLELIENLDHFDKLYENLEKIDINLDNADEVIGNIVHYRNLICAKDNQYDKIKKKFKAQADAIEDESERKRIFGEVLDIIDGTKDSELIKHLQEKINEKYDTCFKQMIDFVQNECNPRPEAVFIKSGRIKPLIQKYKNFLKYANEYGFVRERDGKEIPDEFFDCPPNINSLDENLNQLDEQYAEQGPNPLVAKDICNEKAAKEKKKEYVNLLDAVRKAVEKEKQEGRDFSEDFNNYETAVNAETNKIETILVDAERRCKIATKRFTEEKGSVDYAYEVFDFTKTPDDKVIEILGKGNTPVYNEFESVKGTKKKIEYCNQALQKIKNWRANEREEMRKRHGRT